MTFIVDDQHYPIKTASALYIIAPHCGVTKCGKLCMSYIVKTILGTVIRSIYADLNNHLVPTRLNSVRPGFEWVFVDLYNVINCRQPQNLYYSCPSSTQDTD